MEEGRKYSPEQETAIRKAWADSGIRNSEGQLPEFSLDTMVRLMTHFYAGCAIIRENQSSVFVAAEGTTEITPDGQVEVKIETKFPLK